jgi:hypothetical protein
MQSDQWFPNQARYSMDCYDGAPSTDFKNARDQTNSSTGREVGWQQKKEEVIEEIGDFTEAEKQAYR